MGCFIEMDNKVAPIDTKNPMDSIDSMSSINTKNILITGGCGFIGVNLVDFLLGKGISKLRIHDNLSIGRPEYLESVLNSHGQVVKSFVDDKRIVYIVKISNQHQTNATNSINSINPINSIDQIRIELIVGDIRDKGTCLNATKDIGSVVHLAAHAGIIPSIQNPFYDFEVNVLGTLNLLHASVANKIDKFIFASSNAPLGNQNPPLNEMKVPKPLSPYGASKLACEGYCSAFYGSYGLKTVSLRFSNAYGPYSLHKNSVIAKFIKDGIIKKKLTIYGDGTQTRDFIHVDDICNAIYTILTFDDFFTTKINPTNSIDSKSSIWGETFHLGTGKETSIILLAEYAMELFREDVKIIFEPLRKGEISRNYSEISKARRIFGFNPQVDFARGLKEVYEWFMSTDYEGLRNSVILSGSE